jgi:hypothetical protein
VYGPSCYGQTHALPAGRLQVFGIRDGDILCVFLLVGRSHFCSLGTVVTGTVLLPEHSVSCLTFSFLCPDLLSTNGTVLSVSVAGPDPGSGAFFTPRSGIWDGYESKIRIRNLG